ncbi:MAG: HAMP domain-containing protein [Deltaproteobacteria bacterium]|nr:HAMP domain-containing protein [Deltaproteobacteria bacterium]
MAAPVVRKARYSLRLKLALGLILIIAVIFSGLAALNLLTLISTREKEAQVNRETVGRVVVAALTGRLGSEDIGSDAIRTFLYNFLSVAIVQNDKNRDIAFGLVIDNNGRVIAGRALPALVALPTGERPDSEATVLQEIARLDGNLGGNMRVARYTLKTSRGNAGKLFVGTSLSRLHRETRRDLIFNVSVALGGLVVLVIYAGVMLTRLVTRPLGQVVSAMHDVQDGHFDTAVHLARNDEIGVLADTYNFMVQGLREREHLKDAFSRYVSSQVYERIKLGGIRLTGEQRQATVLFSDIRSFTAISELLQPADVVRMLNDYFNVMVEIVFQHEGFLNKFIGDALMAVYNVPLDQTEPELRAVRTAIQMMQSLEVFNTRRAKTGEEPLKIGIGINTGPVTAGNIGHMRRLEYTVIGDAVNVAQRIEAQTKVSGMPILISDATYRAVAKQVIAESLPPVKVKGKQEAVTLYAVKALAAGVSLRTEPKAAPPA